MASNNQTSTQGAPTGQEASSTESQEVVLGSGKWWGPRAANPQAGTTEALSGVLLRAISHRNTLYKACLTVLLLALAACDLPTIDGTLHEDQSTPAEWRESMRKLQLSYGFHWESTWAEAEIVWYDGPMDCTGCPPNGVWGIQDGYTLHVDRNRPKTLLHEFGHLVWEVYANDSDADHSEARLWQGVQEAQKRMDIEAQ